MIAIVGEEGSTYCYSVKYGELYWKMGLVARGSGVREDSYEC